MKIVDKDLGEIRLIENSRARKIIVRHRDGIYYLTHPSSVNLSSIEKVLEEMKPRLKKLADKDTVRLSFSPETEFSTFSFKLNLIENSVTKNYYTSLREGMLSISCPSDTNYSDPTVQATIRQLIEKALRYEANRLFPKKVESFALMHDFSFSGVKINKSRTRWGSCSSKKSINLSYHCMLLPEYLVDFVILHELCHTIEMNHGPHFWQLLDNVTGGRAKVLTRELKTYKINW